MVKKQWAASGLKLPGRFFALFQATVSNDCGSKNLCVDIFQLSTRRARGRLADENSALQTHQHIFHANWRLSFVIRPVELLEHSQPKETCYGFSL